MISRGYSTDTYNSLQTAYYSPPTPLQRASYGPHMIRLVKEGDAEGVRGALAAGLSPNPCNQFGESLVHMACRRGHVDVLKVLLEAGASVQVSDDYGRTPLHDACWAAEPAFEIVQYILQIDNRLFYMKDCRGSLPLAYAHKHHFEAWAKFLAEGEIMDRCFPQQEPSDEAPALCKLWPNAHPLPTPKGGLAPKLAQMIADGKVTPEEARMLTCDVSTVEEGSEYDSDEDSDYDSEEDDDEIEVGEAILNLAQVNMG
jgi:ankyrin repeat protein